MYAAFHRSKSAIFRPDLNRSWSGRRLPEGGTDMFDVAGASFFSALRAAAERRLGPSHACFLAADLAAREGGADATAAVQKALAALDPEVAAALMGDVHQAMRQDANAILAAWDGGAKH
jgi:hypothetical protein